MAKRMSQEDTYEILKELGGFAPISKIRERAMKKYPAYSLCTYVTKRLKQLEKKGYVTRIVDENKVFWKITKKLKG